MHLSRFPCAHLCLDHRDLFGVTHFHEAPKSKLFAWNHAVVPLSLCLPKISVPATAMKVAWTMPIACALSQGERDRGIESV